VGGGGVVVWRNSSLCVTDSFVNSSEVSNDPTHRSKQDLTNHYRPSEHFMSANPTRNMILYPSLRNASQTLTTVSNGKE
jgi:hypothetical protein